MQQPFGPEKSRMRRLLSFDWDAIAGILAAVAAIVMHFLHLIDQGVLLMITVVLLALLFLRALRREPANERMERGLERTEKIVTDLRSALNPPDAILVGPRELLSCSQRFAGQAQGDMIWFHVCLLMFKPQSLFDACCVPLSKTRWFDPFNSCWTGARNHCGSRRSCRSCRSAVGTGKFALPPGPASMKMFPSSWPKPHPGKRPKPC